MPFSVPDGYFEDFEAKILAETVGTKQPVSLWKRVQPLLYAAAMIVGVMFITRAAINHTQNNTATNTITTAQNDDNTVSDSVLHQIVLDNMSEEQLVEFILASAE